MFLTLLHEAAELWTMFFNLFFTLESLSAVLLLSWLAVTNACSVEIKAMAASVEEEEAGAVMERAVTDR